MVIQKKFVKVEVQFLMHIPCIWCRVTLYKLHIYEDVTTYRVASFSIKLNDKNFGRFSSR